MLEDFIKGRLVARGDRWRVCRTTTGQWAAGPAKAGVYVNRDLTRRWIEFDGWRRAFDFAFFRAGQR